MDETKVHRFVSIEQVVRATQPSTADLETLLHEWGLTRSTQEAMWVIAIDSDLGLKTITEVARGSFHEVTVFIPTILAAVVTGHTDRFYIAHNHPSGPVRPSPKDIELTRDVMAAANAMGLSFEDHIIVGPRGWFSFEEEGLLTTAPSQRAGNRAATKKKGRHA